MGTMATKQIDEYYESLAYWKQQALDHEQELRDIKCNTIMNMAAEVEQLKDENEKVYDALAGNICGYCWQKMEEEPTAKRTHQDHVNELLAEITALKSKLKIAKETLIKVKSFGYKSQWEIVDKALSELGGEM